MINKFPSQYIPNSKLIEILSNVTNTSLNQHILKKRKELIKEIGQLPETKVLSHISQVELSYLKAPKKEEKLPVFLSEEEINKMLEVVRYGNDTRSEVLILFLYNTGCRPGEASRTKVKDIDFNNKFVLVKKTKGKKERTAHIFDENFLQYLKFYTSNKKGEDYLFLSNWNKPYTVKGITKNLKSIAKQAGIDPNKISAHKFRHTHAVHAIKSGVSLVSIRDQLGHSSIAITDKYTKIVDTIRRKDYEGHQPFSLKPSQKKSKYCLKCGKEMPLNALFCPDCGAKQIQ